MSDKTGMVQEFDPRATHELLVYRTDGTSRQHVSSFDNWVSAVAFAALHWSADRDQRFVVVDIEDGTTIMDTHSEEVHNILISFSD